MRKDTNFQNFNNRMKTLKRLFWYNVIPLFSAAVFLLFDYVWLSYWTGQEGGRVMETLAGIWTAYLIIFVPLFLCALVSYWADWRIV